MGQWNGASRRRGGRRGGEEEVSHESSRINTNLGENIEFSSMQTFFISAAEMEKLRELRVLCGKKKVLKGAIDPTQEQTREQDQRCR